MPLFILWFGLGSATAIGVVFYAALFPMLLNAWSGMRAVNPLWLRAGSAMGADERSLFWKVIIPGASPFIITGLRQAFLRAWIAVVGAEMLAASDWGLGWVIFDAKEFLKADVMLASLAVIEDEQLVSNAERTGTALISALQDMVDEYELLAQVRGRGLMIGLEFGKPKSLNLKPGWSMLQAARVGLFAQMVVVALFQRHRILTQVSGDHTEVIKLLPPLMIGDEEVALFREAFDDVMKDAHKGSGLMWDFGRTLVKQAVNR